MRAPNLESGWLRVRCDAKLKKKIYERATSLRVGMDALVEAVLNQTEDNWLELYLLYTKERLESRVSAASRRPDAPRRKPPELRLAMPDGRPLGAKRKKWYHR